MRTVPEIKALMTASFMANTHIKAMYDPTGTWTSSTTFEDVFASTSIESIMFYIVAVCAYGLEFLFDAHKTEVEAMEARMRVGSKEWWRQLAFNFQLGDNLVFNSSTNTFEYSAIDETKKKIKYCDIRETGNGLVMLVSEADGSGEPIVLDSGTRTAFDTYIRKTKIAGVKLNWNSYNTDLLKIILTVKYNPLVISSNGSLISNSATFPAVDAIKAYLANIPYGSGLLNKSKLIDAIQAVEGVDDVYFNDQSNWLQVKTDYVGVYENVATQDLRAFSGSFKSDVLNITYIANV